MEEWIGEKWHNFVVGKSATNFPDAKVELEDYKTQLSIFFRAMGGDKSFSIENSSALRHGGYQGFLQKISGSGEKVELAHFGSEQLYLPAEIAYFNDKKLNKDLYIWLTAIASIGKLIPEDSWILKNQQLTQLTLNKWPGLRTKYDDLVEAHLAQRLKYDDLPLDLDATETLIIESLRDPFKEISFLPKSRYIPQPVVLWMYQAPKLKRNKKNNSEQDENSTNINPKPKNEFKKKYKAEQIDENEKEGGLMSFRLESLFSWSEFINLDRSPDDSEDEDAIRTADDLDHLSITTGETSNKIKIDLDFPSQEYDDVVLASDILLPEWDYKKNRMIKDHCCLYLMEAKPEPNNKIPQELKWQAAKLRRQFDMIRPQRQWFNNQFDGDEIDINSYIAFNTDKLLGQVRTDPKLYRQLRNSYRDLSCLLLADLSLSTDSYANNDKKIIDIIRESLFLFAESLGASGDKFSIAGFSSKRRNHIRYYPIKTLNQKYDESIVSKINSIKPGYFTRMGAAIRYATVELTQQKNQQKLLLILTDGKPNDLDKYESRYGIEDTKHAILEAKQSGIEPFCISIDQYSSDYLPYIFGSQSYIHIKRAEELPEKLPLLYLRLTS
jgi:nitric oxide reductase NorD protein